MIFGICICIGTQMAVSDILGKDPNFHIYLCFGQSNMEGQGKIEKQDKTVSSRFQVFQALDCPKLGREKAKWYPATPPLCQCESGLSPADYFGRHLLAKLPDSIKVGIINVAVAGCDIRVFDKDKYKEFDSTYKKRWFLKRLRDYGGNPYNHLITLAQSAQKDGVLKGILLHQGETNTGDEKWPSYVNKIYNDMLDDLSIDSKSVPLIVGEVVSSQNSCCSSMNKIIQSLPDVIPTAYIVSSEGCAAKDDAHFSSEGYREMGRRYAEKLLSLK